MKQPKKSVKKPLLPPHKEKTVWDALKAVGHFYSTFGYATEGYPPPGGTYPDWNKKKMPKKVSAPKQKKGGQVKNKK